MSEAADILIVEDEPAIAANISDMLQLAHYAPRKSSTPDEAMAAVASRVPDLVLMDIQLSADRDGIDIAAEMLERYGVHVMYVTANAEDEFLARAQATQPLGYLVKPFDGKQLLSMVRVALGISAERKYSSRRLNRLERALDSGSDAVLFLDQQGRILHANKAAVHGAGNRKITGELFHSVIPLETGGAILNAASLLRQMNGHPVTGRAEWKSAAGNQPVLYSAALLQSDRAADELVITLRHAAAAEKIDVPAPPAAPSNLWDDLIGAPSRGAALEIIRDLRRSKTSGYCVFLHIRHYQMLKRRYGSSIADSILVEFRKYIVPMLPRSATLCSWLDGGFLVIAPGIADRASASDLADRLTRAPLRYDLATETRTGLIAVSSEPVLWSIAGGASLDEMTLLFDSLVSAPAER